MQSTAPQHISFLAFCADNVIVSVEEVVAKIWLATFMHYDLGLFDHQAGRVECAPNSFEAQVLPMSPQ